MSPTPGAGRRAVLVTGASSGIGEATALHLARRGLHVFAGVRRGEDGERLRGRLARPDDTLTPVRLDVTVPAEVEAAAAEIGERAGTLAGLVNNAGLASGGPLEFADLDDVRRLFEVNTLGALAVTQAVLPLLRASDGRPGRIVNVSSTSGRLATPFVGAYCASKAALDSLTEALRHELRPWRIHVAAVVPGIVRTPIWPKAVADLDSLLGELPQEALRLYGAQLRAGREYIATLPGSPPEQVARRVAHALLARRPRLEYVVGENARRELFVSWLPARLRERVIHSTFPVQLSGDGDS